MENEKLISSQSSLRASLLSILAQDLQARQHPPVFLFLKSNILVLCFIVTYHIFCNSSGQSVDYKKGLTVAIKGNKAVFVQNFLDNEIDGQLDNRTISRLCAETKWMPGLIFKCEPPEGGVGNVRYVFLNCPRYSIEAGATGFVIPRMLALTSSTQSSTVPFTHFFDLAHFTSSLLSSGPQIHIYNHANDVYDIPSTSPSIPMTLTAFNNTVLIEKHILGEPALWNTSFAAWLRKKHPKAPSADKPLLVSMAPALLEFPISYDDPKFVPAYGRLLRAREGTRRLAAVVLFALSQKYELGIDSGEREMGVVPAAFYGAHLRTGADATAAGWTGYEVQSANHLHETTPHNLHIMQIASGNSEDVAKLTVTAADNSPPITRRR